MLGTRLLPRVMERAKLHARQAWLANLRRLWDGPALDPTMRRRMAEHVLRWVGVPALSLCAFVVIVLVAKTGFSQPTRLVAPAVFTLPCIWVRRLCRAERWLAAAAVFCAAAAAATLVAVLLNGVRAPGYGVGVLVLMLIVVLYGLRWGVLAALGFTLIGGVYVVLEAHGLTVDVAQPPTSLVYCIQVAVFMLTITLVGGPQLLLTEALRATQLQQRAAREAQAARESSELAFHAVFDQASVALVLLTADGDILQLNARAACFLHEAERALVGTPLTAAACFNTAQRTQLAHAVGQAALGHASAHELSRTPDTGETHVYQVALSPFLDGAGQVRQVLVELVDVSDLVQTRSMLAQARRLESLGKLSGGVAHDLNNMFAAILGGCELVRIARGDARKIEDHVKLIQTSVQRAATLTKQLLAFGRKDRWNSEQLDVNRLMYEVSRLLERTLHKNVRVVLLPSDEPSYVRADAAALEHVLLNLVLNGQAAMPNGGTLTLACRRAVLEPCDCESLYGQIAPGPSVILSVEDTGTGMSREVREHMFDPFFTTKAAGEGTGLGLSAVHGTMRGHHGAIAVHSQVGVGTRIELLLPALESLANEAAQERFDGGVPASLKARVLLADDEALARSAIASLLVTAGCEVQALADGAAIMEVLRHGPAPDVIVTDLAMPGLCGVELVKAIEALRPDCPLLLITGYSGDDVAAALPSRRGRLRRREPVARAEVLRSGTELLAAGQKRQRTSALTVGGA